MLYEKIEIHSEADLPKEDEMIYGVHFKQSEFIDLVDPAAKGKDFKWILNNVDWYLSPVAEVTDEGVIEEMQKQITHSKEVIESDNSPMSETTIEHGGIIMAYEYLIEWIRDKSTKSK